MAVNSDGHIAMLIDGFHGHLHIVEVLSVAGEENVVRDFPLQ